MGPLPPLGLMRSRDEGLEKPVTRTLLRMNSAGIANDGRAGSPETGPDNVS
jgi:hypothetical protein